MNAIAADGGVDTAMLADGAVTTAKLADSSVTSAKIVDGTIATADIADGAVTDAKLATAKANIAGGNTFSGTQEIDQTLSGSTKTFLTLKATDGKTYAIQQDTSGRVIFYNVTDSKQVFSINTSGKLRFGTVETSDYALIDHDSTAHALIIETPQAGSNHEYVVIYTWNGSTQKALLQIGGSTNASSSAVWIDESGDVTVVGNGVFSGNFVFGPTVSSSQAFGGTDTTNHWTAFWTPQAGASHYGMIFVVWTTATSVVPLHLGGASNNSGALTWLDENGGTFFSKTASAQSLSSSGTINTSGKPRNIRVTESGNVTGMILQAGADGQEICILNEAAFTSRLRRRAPRTSPMARQTISQPVAPPSSFTIGQPHSGITCGRRETQCRDIA